MSNVYVLKFKSIVRQLVRYILIFWYGLYCLANYGNLIIVFVNFLIKKYYFYFFSNLIFAVLNLNKKLNTIDIKIRTLLKKYFYISA